MSRTAPIPPTDPMQPPAFLDVPFLLDASLPAPRTGWFWYGLGGFFLVVIASTYATLHSPGADAAMSLISGVAMFGIMFGMSAVSWHAIRRARMEQAQLEAVEELVQLRRWPQAAVILNGMLAQPARTAHGRLQSLIYLTAVLARYNRYTDAIAVEEHLLEGMELDPGTAFGLRLGRAMALLQEERLFDADRAINELRRSAGDGNSAGFALVEIYRDVKTGHPDEAIELFNAKLPTLRQQLGHRLADAWALIAKAHDLLEHEPEARAAYTNATLLAPAAELHRRYLEVSTLASKYTPAEAPVEMR